MSDSPVGPRGELERAALRALERNSRRYGDQVYFTADYRHYPFQYYWDSCAQAIVMSLFDGRRAEAEMYSLLSKQFPDGCMPYMTSWHKPPFPWNFSFSLASWIGEDGRANMSTQPMLSAVATWEIYKRTGSREFLERVISELALEADYLGVQRDLLDDGLVVIVNPMEAGSNESPVYDEIMGLPRPRGLGPLQHLLFYLKLTRQMAAYKKADYDLEKVAELGLFLVEDIMNNSMFCRSMSAMGDILSELGDERAAAEYRKQAVLLAERLERLCWDEDDGFFYTRYGSREGRRFSRVKTLAGLLPLYTGLISREKAKALVEKNLDEGGCFWPRFPLSFTSMDEPTWRPGLSSFPFPSLWRGGTYVLMNWMMFIGLLEYGYDEQAEMLAASTISMVAREGFREVFNSLTGRGCGCGNYGSTIIAADMAERSRSLR